MLELSTLSSFKSIYSVRIYTLIKQYQNLTAFRKFTLNEFRKILGISRKYTAIKDLRINVLEPVKKEFNEHENLKGIEFDYELLRIGRTFQEIKFYFNFSKAKPLTNVSDHLYAMNCIKENSGRCDVEIGASAQCDYCIEYVRSKYR